MKIPKFEAQTEWVKPTEFPDLRQVDEIAIDLDMILIVCHGITWVMVRMKLH